MLSTRIEDNIMIATFEHGKYNTITAETVQQIRQCVKEVNEKNEIKGLIFTGAGKVFCSGFHLPTFLGFKNLEEVIPFFQTAEEVYIELFLCQKPVIAAINGAAVAGGLITAMACDYRIAKNHPKIALGMSEIKIGLGLSIVQTELMRFGLGSDRMFQTVMFGGNLYPVAQAKELGIVDEIAEEADLMNRAKQVVTSWIDNPGRAFILLKRSLRQPYADRMRQRLRDENWQEGFNCMFDPGTRAAMDMVNKMMG